MPIIDNCSEPVLTSCELKTMVCDEVVLTASNEMNLLVKNIVLYIKHFKYLFSQITVTSKKTMHERFRWTHTPIRYTLPY